MATNIVRRWPSRSRARIRLQARSSTTMVAALMTASTCGNSRMTFIAASTLAHLDHEADVQRQSHADEDDQHDPIASPHIWVKVCHVDFVEPVEIRPRT